MKFAMLIIVRGIGGINNTNKNSKIYKHYRGGD